MLDKARLLDFVQSKLEGTDCFLTDLTVSPQNQVLVEIDSDSSVDIDFCVRLSREIGEEFPADEEDYELEVGSAGLTSDLKLPRQYRKYLGQDLEIWLADGRKLTALLRAADDDGISVVYSVKKKEEGSKRPVEVEQEESIPYSSIRRARYLLKF